MKDLLKIMLLMAAAAGLVYWATILFIPLRIGSKVVDRKITQQSQQYVETQRSALVTLYASYTNADEGHKEGIRLQMCQVANTIDKEEIPAPVLRNLKGCL